MPESGAESFGERQGLCVCRVEDHRSKRVDAFREPADLALFLRLVSHTFAENLIAQSEPAKDRRRYPAPPQRHQNACSIGVEHQQRDGRPGRIRSHALGGLLGLPLTLEEKIVSGDIKPLRSILETGLDGAAIAVVHSDHSRALQTKDTGKIGGQQLALVAALENDAKSGCVLGDRV